MSDIYLDNNIFISIQEKRNGFDSVVVTKLITSLHRFFYSSAHIQEANRIIEDPDKIESNIPVQRFKIISLITENNYLYDDLDSRNIIHIKELPENVYETIHLIKQGQPLINSLLGFIDDEQKQEFRKQNTLNPEKLNNYSATEIVKVVEKVIKGTIPDFIEKAIGYFPENQRFGLSNRIAGVFELLDLFGFWKDQFTFKSNYARLWDANHAFFASICNYFVSDDRRTREKTKVVYQLYNIKTNIISSKELINLITTN